ncbi:CA14 [Cordylochernes scorpioides]|uniref:carbonic anhydrase n=1 Tax=Cordylochernes scorpioides TaxID=51811 RepID=A0ABY6KMZ4_9ARAC|nr:CA14 [Cordylochernes scorpioides]
MSKEVDVDYNLKPLLFRNYIQSNRRFRIRNTGHTERITAVVVGNLHWVSAVEVMPMDNVTPFIKSGGLNSSYRFVQMHFHWGGADYCGSEHSLNGRFYPMEVILLAKWQMLGTSLVARVAPIFQLLGPPLDNPSLQIIVDMLPRVRYRGQRAIINKGLNLEGFLPSRRELFFRYSGSLSVPPCSEVVTWTVYPKLVYISRGQYQTWEIFHKEVHSNSLKRGGYRRNNLK